MNWRELMNFIGEKYLLMIAFLFLVAAVVLALCSQLPAEAAAAWVQALGTIAAIFSAVWVAEEGHRRSMLLVEMERLRIDQERRKEKADLCAVFEVEIDGVVKSLRKVLQIFAETPADEMHSGIAEAEVSASIYAAQSALVTLGALRDTFLSNPATAVAHYKLVRELEYCADHKRYCLERGLGYLSKIGFSIERLEGIRAALSHVDPSVMSRFEVRPQVCASGRV